MTEADMTKILLVDDNPTDVELALRGLRKCNLANKVQVLKDGAEALEFLFKDGEYCRLSAADKPNLILLDLKLPKVGGLEVLRKVKSDECTKLIPVVIMTSSDEEKDMVESYKLGVNSYITKPVDFVKFTEIVAKLGFYWVLLNKTPQD